MVLQLPRADARVFRRFALAIVLTAFLAGGARADVNRIVLRVNDEIATLWEFEQRRRSRISEIQRADLPPERRQRLLADVGAQTMRDMYEELLVLSRAEQLDVVVSDREVAAAVAQTKAQFGIEDDQEFGAALASSGMTIEDLGEQMRRNLLIREVMGREVQQRIELEDEDLRRYYRDHPDEFSRPRRLEVREVVIPDEAASSDEARDELAADARSALLAGEAGSERLAEMDAAGQATALLALGWIERGDLEPAIERGIWELEPGAVSEPIVARGGRYVVEILAEEQALLKPFVDVQEEIRSKLRAGRYQEEMTNFLAELGDSSFVVQNLPPEAAGFSTTDGRESRDELSGFELALEEAPEAEIEDAPEVEPDPEAGTSEPPE